LLRGVLARNLTDTVSINMALSQINMRKLPILSLCFGCFALFLNLVERVEIVHLRT
jgi:hypothetical protein